MGAEVSEPFDPLAPGEAKPKSKRAPRVKKDAPADPLVPGEKPKPKRVSRAKPKAAPTVSTDTGNVAMPEALPELTREVSFAFGVTEQVVPAEEKAADKPKAVRKPRAKKDATAEPTPAESPKWLKFKAEVEEGKFDNLREDGQYHPGKLSIRVSGALVSNPEWRPLLAELLKSRGRFEVCRIFGL